jgi:hypothetical protein
MSGPKVHKRGWFNRRRSGGMRVSIRSTVTACMDSLRFLTAPRPFRPSSAISTSLTGLRRWLPLAPPTGRTRLPPDPGRRARRARRNMTLAPPSSEEYGAPGVRIRTGVAGLSSTQLNPECHSTPGGMGWQYNGRGTAAIIEPPPTTICQTIGSLSAAYRTSSMRALALRLRAFRVTRGPASAAGEWDARTRW